MANFKGKSTFRWQRPPSALISDFERFEKKVNRTQRIVFNKVKDILVSDAKAHAPWQDQTGDARKTLHARYETVAADISERIVNVYLIHGVDYGVFLELANSGRFAIIHDTLVRTKPKIMALLAASLKDFR